MFDINGGEFLVILLVAVVVIGPTRLPRYAEQLGRLTRQARRYLQDARERVDTELGDDVKDIDWAALDPRRYDPRRIVRDALLDPDPAQPARPEAARAPYRTTAAAPARTAGADVPAAAAAVVPAAPDPAPGEPATAGPPSAPYDDEAT